MTTIPDGTLLEGGNGKPANDLESAKFSKDKETVDVVQPTAKLIGLTKEQLEQYRNDPFWKAVRYTLFIAFWLVWLVMFVGAILIVVMSPKCIDVKWQNKMVAYKIFSLAFKDSDKAMDANAGFGDFVGIKEKLGDIREMGANAIWPTPVLNYDKNGLSPDMTVDLDVSEQLGGQEKFKDLVKSAHAKDVKVIVDLPLTVVNGENWVKKKGIQDGLKDTKGKVSSLNLKSQQVQEALVELAHNFLTWGIDGLNLADYGMAADTADLISLTQRIRELAGAEHIPIYLEKANGVNSDNYGIESVVGDEKVKGVRGLVEKLHKKLDEVSKQQKDGPNGTVPTVWRLGSLDPGRRRVDELLDDASLKLMQKHQISMLFSLVQLFIPGPIIVLYGEELGLLSGKATGDKKPNLVVYPWDNSTLYTKENQFLAVPQNAASANYRSQSEDENSALKVFSKLAKLHQHNDFVMGQFSHTSLGPVDLYLVERHPASIGNYYGLIVNWNGSEQEVNVAELPANIKGKKFAIVASTDQKLAETAKLDDEGNKVNFPAYGALAFQTE